jgi:hypothetical protein
MQSRSRYFLPVFVLFFFCRVPLQAVAIDRAFALKQKHYFLGQWLVFVNNDKVKATNLNQGYSVVTMAPKWKVVFYRDDSNKSYESSMATFLRCGILFTGGYYTEGRISDAEKLSVSFKGIKATRFLFQRDAFKPSTTPAWTLADKSKEAPVSESKYWISPMISDNPTICHFLQRLFMTPSTSGYPLAFSDTRIDGTTNVVLDLLSCKLKNPTEVPIDYPSKLQPCKTQREITMSAGNQDTLNGWADSLGTP